MKRALQYTCCILIMALLLLSSCKDSGSPKSVTQLFLISLNKNDLETARSISTANTHDMLKIWGKLSNGKFSEEELQKRAESFKVKITKVQKESDTTVLVSYTTAPQILPFSQIQLQKQTDRDGRTRWKVDISTLDFSGSTDIYNQDSSGTNDGQLHPLPDSVAAQE